MNDKDNNSKSNARHMFLDYMDWQPDSIRPPTYKHISDNLRAYLTIGAYMILIAYLWSADLPGAPVFLTKLTAIVWSIWLAWFAILTLTQSVHIYIEYSDELFQFLTGELNSSLTTTDGELTKAGKLLHGAITITGLIFGVALLSSAVYLAIAFLQLHP